MCGICGVVRLGDAAEIDVERLRAMMETLKHRGPDDEGIFANHQVALGFVVLALLIWRVAINRFSMKIRRNVSS